MKLVTSLSTLTICLNSTIVLHSTKNSIKIFSLELAHG
ncbi:hypothetical protein DSUL_20146 [Desulfovibrionales bacterium]